MRNFEALITIRNTTAEPPQGKKRPYFARLTLDSTGKEFNREFARIGYQGEGKNKVKVFNFRAVFGQVFEARLARVVPALLPGGEPGYRFVNETMYFEVDRLGRAYNLKSRLGAILRLEDHLAASKNPERPVEDCAITAIPLSHPDIRVSVFEGRGSPEFVGIDPAAAMGDQTREVYVAQYKESDGR